MRFTAGQLEEDILERARDRRQLGDHQALCRDDPADLLARLSRDHEGAAIRSLDRRTLRAKGLGKSGRIGSRNPQADRPSAGQFRDGGLRDAPPVVDHHGFVGYGGHLGEHVTRDQNGASAVCQGAEQIAQPSDPGRIEPVGGLIQHQDARFAEQSGGQAQALLHPERVAPDPASGGGLEVHHLEHLLDA